MASRMSSDTSDLFRSKTMTVKPEWVDYNGHLNMAYYHVLIDACLEEVHQAVGLGPAYRAHADASIFVVETHTTYVRELLGGDPAYVTCQMLETDEKRIHSFLELYHAGEGFLSATSEQLHLHVDMATKKVSPFPEAIRTNIETMRLAHALLPRSERICGIMGLKRK